MIANPFLQDEFINQTLEGAGINSVLPYQWLKIGNCELASQKVVFLLFDSKMETPICVLKMGRHPEDYEQLEKDFAIQTHLWRSLTDHPFIAKPIAFGRGDKNPYLLESWLPGTSLLRNVYLGKRSRFAGIRNDVREIINQIYIPFLHATTDQSKIIDLKESYLCENKQINIQCPELRISTDVQKQIQNIFNSNTSWTIPSSSRHGDFWLGNILVHHEKYYLLDWDKYQSDSNPFFDLFHFWITYSLNLPDNNETAAQKFLQCFLQNKWFIENMQRTTTDVINHLQVTKSTLLISFSIFMLEILQQKKDTVSESNEDYQIWLGIAQEFFNHFSEFKELYQNPALGSEIG